MEHGAVSKMSYYQFYYQEITEHTELIIKPKENGGRQNSNTMPGRGRDRWQKKSETTDNRLNDSNNKRKENTI